MYVRDIQQYYVLLEHLQKFGLVQLIISKFFGASITSVLGSISTAEKALLPTGASSLRLGEVRYVRKTGTESFNSAFPFFRIISNFLGNFHFASYTIHSDVFSK